MTSPVPTSTRGTCSQNVAGDLVGGFVVSSVHVPFASEVSFGVFSTISSLVPGAIREGSWPPGLHKMVFYSSLIVKRKRT